MASTAGYLARRAAQKERVRLLYRRAHNWAIHRHLFYQDASDLRGKFEANLSRPLLAETPSSRREHPPFAGSAAASNRRTQVCLYSVFSASLAHYSNYTLLQFREQPTRGKAASCRSLFADLASHILLPLGSGFASFLCGAVTVSYMMLGFVWGWWCRIIWTWLIGPSTMRRLSTGTSSTPIPTLFHGHQAALNSQETLLHLKRQAQLQESTRDLGSNLIAAVNLASGSTSQLKMGPRTMGVLARRFLNLIVPGHTPGVKSLRRIDLSRQKLFYRSGSAAPHGDGSEPAGGQDAISRPSVLEMKTVRFAGPSFTFRALNSQWKMDCFPLADYSECKVICADQSGRGFVFDPDSPKVGAIPPLRKPKVMPISVFVHKPQVDGNVFDDSNGSSLFLMEKAPQPEARRCGGDSVSGSVPVSEQFVGFINCHMGIPGAGKSWHCQLLPPPPFVQETIHWSNNNCPQITAYGVVGGGSHVFISVEGVGTYCLDTESLEWSKAGEWTLPFHGKVEYVPELKLWFGLSAAGAQHLAAADLSGMPLGSSQPPQRLVGGPWQELVDLPEKWKQCKDPQFVSLGSGRFCVARFFQEAGSRDGAAHKNFTILTGVEVNSRGKCEGGTRELELQMTPHKSRRINDTSIETLF